MHRVSNGYGFFSLGFAYHVKKEKNEPANSIYERRCVLHTEVMLYIHVKINTNFSPIHICAFVIREYSKAFS